MQEKKQKKNKTVNHKGTVMFKYAEICSAYNDCKFSPCPTEQYAGLRKHNTLPFTFV